MIDLDKLTLSQLKAEIDKEANPDRLRALVGFRRLLIELEQENVTGKIEADVSMGVVKKFRYPRTVDISA